MEILSAFCVIALLVHLAGLGVAVVRARSRLKDETAAPIPPVTILRPVCGIENHLTETLASTFALRHPHLEIIFCVASPLDPAIPVVEEVIAAHPSRRARLLVGDDRISVNPKLNNLVKGWHAASSSWIVMVDSNVLMPPDLVERCFARWTSGTGLVCSPPVGTAPDGFWAEVECAWLNAFQARWQLAADALGFGFAQGKVMLWRRDILDAAGGIERLAAEVAEDAAATKIVRAAGLSVRLVDRPFPQPLGRRSAGEVWRRQLRWARLRRASFPLFFAPEILAGGTVPIVAAAALAASGTWSLGAAAGFAALWYAAELATARLAGWPVPRRALAATLLRDLALPVLWIAALVGHGFVWRGTEMAVSPSRPGLRAMPQRVLARVRGLARSR